MKKLTVVVDERELCTTRAALLLPQEQVDAMPEDLAQMIAAHGKVMMAFEIEQLSRHRQLDGLKRVSPSEIDSSKPAARPVTSAQILLIRLGYS